MRTRTHNWMRMHSWMRRKKRMRMHRTNGAWNLLRTEAWSLRRNGVIRPNGGDGSQAY